MKRKNHEQEVRKKILMTANRLFLDQGYQQTTVRQITQSADIRIGTLYHFYKDKEDIFKNIVLKIFDRVIERTEGLIPDHLGSAELYISAEFIWHLEAMLQGNNTAELYYIAYSASSISSEILKRRNQRHATLFEHRSPKLTIEEHRIKTLMCKGFLQAAAMEIMQDRLDSRTDFIERSIRMMLELYQTPTTHIEQTLDILRSLPISDYVRGAESKQVIS